MGNTTPRLPLTTPSGEARYPLGSGATTFQLRVVKNDPPPRPEIDSSLRLSALVLTARSVLTYKYSLEKKYASSPKEAERLNRKV